jgi:translation initiation factor 3 subunit E
LQEECAPFFERFQGEEGRKLIVKLQQENKFNVENLSKEYGISESMVTSIYKYAKSQFECGYYAVAAECLYFYRTLSTNKDHDTPAMWGKLASEILLQSWDVALEDMTHLREEIEATNTPQLTARAWLIHWALLVFFNHPSGRDGIIDLFFQERYLNVIQTICPHLLRYLATAVITNKKKRGHMKDLVRVIEQEANNYRDPITEFIECLYIKHDFEGAQEKLRQCTEVLSHDFFLVACHDEFIENARLMIFDSYCRIHSVIDIRMVAEKLNMNEEGAEIWIVNLIREARLDARMDQAQKAVVMGSQTRSHYQLVKDKTRNLVVRTTLLVNPYQGPAREREDRRGIGSALDADRRRENASATC